MGGFMRWFIGRTGAVVAVPLLLAGLAGCGASGGRAAATATTGQQDVVAVVHELVRCARANGMPDLPDPQIDTNGQVKFPEGTPEPPQSVLRACQSIADRLPGAPRGGEFNPAAVPALVRFAKCIREHGFPGFPDPRPDGSFKVSELPQGVKPGNPPFDAALRACRQVNPTPDGGMPHVDD
jgi:hypothetical protein